jgi:hypothetical protein
MLSKERDRVRYCLPLSIAPESQVVRDYYRRVKDYLEIFVQIYDQHFSWR